MLMADRQTDLLRFAQSRPRRDTADLENHVPEMEMRIIEKRPVYVAQPITSNKQEDAIGLVRSFKNSVCKKQLIRRNANITGTRRARTEHAELLSAPINMKVNRYFYMRLYVLSKSMLVYTTCSNGPKSNHDSTDHIHICAPGIR